MLFDMLLTVAFRGNNGRAIIYVSTDDGQHVAAMSSSIRELEREVREHERALQRVRFKPLCHCRNRR